MSEDSSLISIDGSHGEGGGQIIRTSCALAAVTGKTIEVFNIRKNRRTPGLRRQHLIGIQSLNKLCNGFIEGAALGSQEILFRPGEIKPKRLKIEINTAGSITLVLQTLLLPSFLSPTPIILDFLGGATDTYFSPTIDYNRNVFFKFLEKLGLSATIKIKKRGFFPSGDSRLSVKIDPGFPKSLNFLDRGSLNKVTIISGASNNLRDAKVSERQATAASKLLSSKLDISANIQIEYYDTLSTGSQINIIAEFENSIIGVDGLGSPGKRAERVGRQAAKNFIKEFRSNACMDKYACDQILPYIALSKAESIFTTSEITEHTKTNLWVISHFLKRTFTMEKEESRFVVRVR
ncbi:MAG TPA: RNA 3'-terminal phosphate cyclase [Thermodesulfobacteriota bacterium]|nr:RNA 3'-terminal phosphate cyclase [Thermodesulfobacteriota bacterium]